MPPIIVNTVLTSPGTPTEMDHADDDNDEFFDCLDFTDDDDDQAPEDDISGLIVRFKPLAVWNNSEDNLVEYILPPNFGNFLKLAI